MPSSQEGILGPDASMQVLEKSRVRRSSFPLSCIGPFVLHSERCIIAVTVLSRATDAANDGCKWMNALRPRGSCALVRTAQTTVDHTTQVSI
jgi:hypothetical protein